MSDIRSSSGSAVQHGGRLRTELLGIYLNDHLAGATVGTRRAQHMVTTLRGSALAEALEPIATEIAQDRASLLERAQRQLRTLEDLRLQEAQTVFRTT
ncbi:hypothetical protein ACFPH6_06340 [Streptomyces xiangluensis]|uniref:Uncharacterized protein n=1 Tax=Streptomyces xiangluensis TaxID=2665720 RepID=A0ABV8YJF3_9ACTN